MFQLKPQFQSINLVFFSAKTLFSKFIYTKHFIKSFNENMFWNTRYWTGIYENKILLNSYLSIITNNILYN